MKKVFKKIRRSWSVIRGSDFPLERMLGKSFIPASELPHRQLLELYDRYGRNGFDLRETLYYKRIVSFSGDLADNFGALPEGLDISPGWWFMPWAMLPKKSVVLSCDVLQKRAIDNIHKFFDLYESVLCHGYIAAEGGAISGYILEHPEYGQVFSHIDGHHRMAVLDYLSSSGRLPIRAVRVEVLGHVRRCELLAQSAYRIGASRGCFSERDAFALFDHVFFQLSISR